MTISGNKEYMLVSVSVPRKIVGAIDKLKEMGLILSRTDFMRNVIVNGVKEIANTKEMIDVLMQFETICEKKGLSDEAEARKYFKWLKQGINDIRTIAHINESTPERVNQLLKKHFNISLEV